MTRGERYWPNSWQTPPLHEIWEDFSVGRLAWCHQVLTSSTACNRTKKSIISIQGQKIPSTALGFLWAELYTSSDSLCPFVRSARVKWLCTMCIFWVVLFGLPVQYWIKICLGKDLEGKDYWSIRYLHFKRLYREFSSVTKNAANDKFMKSANNPCEAAWSVIYVRRTRQVGMSCLCSSYGGNRVFQRCGWGGDQQSRPKEPNISPRVWESNHDGMGRSWPKPTDQGGKGF